MSETLKVELIEPGKDKEEILSKIDQEMKDFHDFFTGGLKQEPATRMEAAYLKTYLAWRLLGADSMIR